MYATLPTARHSLVDGRYYGGLTLSHDKGGGLEYNELVIIGGADRICTDVTDWQLRLQSARIYTCPLYTYVMVMS